MCRPGPSPRPDGPTQRTGPSNDWQLSSLFQPPRRRPAESYLIAAIRWVSSELSPNDLAVADLQQAVLSPSRLRGSPAPRDPQRAGKPPGLDPAPLPGE